MSNQSNAGLQGHSTYQLKGICLQNKDDSAKHELFVRNHVRYELLPGQSMNRNRRRALKAKPSFVFLNASEAGHISRRDFDEATVRHLIDGADLIVIWGSDISDEQAEIVQAHIYASRHIVVVLTHCDEEVDWALFATRAILQARVLTFVSKDNAGVIARAVRS